MVKPSNADRLYPCEYDYLYTDAILGGCFYLIWMYVCLGILTQFIHFWFLIFDSSLLTKELTAVFINLFLASSIDYHFFLLILRNYIASFLFVA